MSQATTEITNDHLPDGCTPCHSANRHLRARPTVEAMATSRPAPIGRERHLRELHQLVEGAVAGRGSVMVLVGEAGVGKTRLAEEGAYLAQSAGAHSAWVACWDNAAEPLSLWSALLAATDPDALLSMPSPSGSETDREGARAMWTHALIAHLQATVAGRPTVLIVDDVQWCDPLSLLALEVLGAAIARMPVGLLLTLRDDGAALVGVLDRVSRRGRRLIVPPLTSDELAALAAEVTGRTLTSAAAARLHDRTAGNVLFAREMLAISETGSDVDILSGSASRASALFEPRLAAQSDSSIHVLQAASVIGRRFRLDVLAETVGTTTDAVLELLDEGTTGGIVRGAGIGAQEFVHPLLAEACYASADLPRRVRLHRDVGEAMERLRAVASQSERWSSPITSPTRLPWAWPPRPSNTRRRPVARAWSSSATRTLREISAAPWPHSSCARATMPSALTFSSTLVMRTRPPVIFRQHGPHMKLWSRLPACTGGPIVSPGPRWVSAPGPAASRCPPSTVTRSRCWKKRP